MSRIFLFAENNDIIGRSGMYKIIVANWRNDSTGPMQVVSGAMGKERVHYQAPPAGAVRKEMKTFLSYLLPKF